MASFTRVTHEGIDLTVQQFPHPKWALEESNLGPVLYANTLRISDRLQTATDKNPHPNLVRFKGLIPYFSRSVNDESLPLALRISDSSAALVHEYRDGIPMSDIYEPNELTVKYDEHAPRKLGLDSRKALLKAFFGLCSGISHLHRFGLIHRDINPNNILVTPKIELVAYDYEIAGLVGHPDNLTLGTQSYAAPEAFPKPPIEEQEITINPFIDFDRWYGPPCYRVATRPLAQYKGIREASSPTKMQDIFSLAVTFAKMYTTELTPNPLPPCPEPCCGNMTVWFKDELHSRPEINTQLKSALMKAINYNPSLRQQNVADFFTDIATASGFKLKC